MKQRDHSTLRGEVSATTVHMEQKQEKERLARERVETLEVGRPVCVRRSYRKKHTNSAKNKSVK